LTKLPLKAVLVLFYGKSSIFKFVRDLLSMGEVSTYQFLKETPFVTVPSFSLHKQIAKQADALNEPPHVRVSVLIINHRL